MLSLLFGFRKFEAIKLLNLLDGIKCQVIKNASQKVYIPRYLKVIKSIHVYFKERIR